MELKVDRPALAGQNIDPATFQRVWDRVMPDQAAAPANTSVPDTVVPAVPTTPPAEEQPSAAGEPLAAANLPSVPDCPALSPVPDCPAQPAAPDCPSLPPVPGCPSQPSVPDCPSLPAVPDCPQDSQCPPCPECPAYPGTAASPRTAPAPAPSAPEPPAFCLGEASQGDSRRLEELMNLACFGAAAGRAMARRASGACAKALSALACDHRLAFKRLSAAYFLITAKRYTPKCEALKLPSSLPLALRQQFLWEQQWEQKNSQGAQATADPCLKELYLELAQEGSFHAGTIRSLLEQMA